MINERIDSVSELVEKLSLDVDANTEEIMRLNETDPLANATFAATFNAYDTCTMTKLASCEVPLLVDSEVSPCDTGGNNPYNVSVSSFESTCIAIDQGFI